MAQVPGRFVSVDRRPQTNDPHDPHASRANDRAQILRKKVLLFAVVIKKMYNAGGFI